LGGGLSGKLEFVWLRFVLFKGSDSFWGVGWQSRGGKPWTVLSGASEPGSDRERDSSWISGSPRNDARLTRETGQCARKRSGEGWEGEADLSMYLTAHCKSRGIIVRFLALHVNELKRGSSRWGGGRIEQRPCMHEDGRGLGKKKTKMPGRVGRRGGEGGKNPA